MIRDLSRAVDDGFVYDSQVAEKTRITTGDVRDWIETLDAEGFVDLVRTSDGMRAAITAKGRLALRRDSAQETYKGADHIGVEPIIDLLDETNRLGRDLGRKIGEQYLSLVQPIYDHLEAVHESYLTHFRKYREQISAWEKGFGPGHPIFDRLENDHLFTQSDRIKVVALTESIPMFWESQEKKTIDLATTPEERLHYGLLSFLTSIVDYFRTSQSYGSLDESWWPNQPRGNLLACLRMLFGSKPDEVAGWLGMIQGCRGSRFILQGSGFRLYVGFTLSPSRFEQLRVELTTAIGDFDRVKKTLALAKIDEIVGGLLRGYEKVVRSHQWIIAERLIHPPPQRFS
ncbi:hypothetical protein [Paludisphaera soli]|uniref:hypothetical protein n=1 Tax=Paludisphaera soli TaxID=2712865 RepID=UPI0013EAB226|nr:hypothetical protein [Paludisphaera soli]